MAPFTATAALLSLLRRLTNSILCSFSGGQGVSKYLFIINSIYSNCISDRSRFELEDTLTIVGFKPFWVITGMDTSKQGWTPYGVYTTEIL